MSLSPSLRNFRSLRDAVSLLTGGALAVLAVAVTLAATCGAYRFGLDPDEWSSPL